MRKLKDGRPIYKEWVEYENYIIDEENQTARGVGKRTHYVETDCPSCSVFRVWMPLSKLIANGPDQCDGCNAYNAHLR